MYKLVEGVYISSFYTFKSKWFWKNYIEECEEGACIAMQSKAWMTSTTFYTCLAHFKTCLEERGGISSRMSHLLILDGYNFHITLDVVLESQKTGLVMVILPSHIGHTLQPFRNVFLNLSTTQQTWRQTCLVDPFICLVKSPLNSTFK